MNWSYRESLREWTGILGICTGFVGISSSGVAQTMFSSMANPPSNPRTTVWPWRAPEGEMPLSKALGRFIGEDLAIADVDDAMCVFGDVWLVSDEDDGVSVGVKGIKKCHDFDASLGVEVAGRFVRENYGRAVDEGASDGDALALTT